MPSLSLLLAHANHFTTEADHQAWPAICGAGIAAHGDQTALSSQPAASIEDCRDHAEKHAHAEPDAEVRAR